MECIGIFSKLSKTVKISIDVNFLMNLMIDGENKNTGSPFLLILILIIYFFNECT